MKRRPSKSLLRCGFILSLILAGNRTSCAESLWIEAEHLRGIEGYCWPMGQPEMRKTNGHWGISGPGWAAEWNQGGESGFLSIACGAEDDKAVATADIEIPEAGSYRVWVRYRDVRESTNRFQILIAQPGSPAWSSTYGQQAVIEEDNAMKLYWNWAFGWEQHEVALKKGQATLSLLSAFKESDCRQIDCIVLTTDVSYRPHAKERPRNALWSTLESYRGGNLNALEPLARNKANLTPPAAWKPRTFGDKGFRYLWNVEPQTMKWLGTEPNRVLYPYLLRDKETLEAFENKYGGKQDVPIFSDPRIVPIFGRGASMLATDAANAEEKKMAESFTRWLAERPDRLWGSFGPLGSLTPAAKENFQQHRNRYIGSIARESLGHFQVKSDDMKVATANAKSRREIAEAIGKVAMAANSAAQAGLEEPYRDTIPVNSVGGIPTFALSYLWGARTVGYETAVIPGGPLALQWAFLRGAARQNGGMTATYRYYRFGDSVTSFSESQTFSAPRNILDNYYSVFSGPGVTWGKMDIWYEYMAGSSFFLEEQGFDHFWMPGGTGAAGRKDVQLSPKGKLVDRFLRLTAKEPERGTPFTPVAFLVDYAHGWDPAPYVPHQFGNYAEQPDRTRYGIHEKMLEEYFATAYYPIGPRSEEPVSALKETYVPGIFGDIFDVVNAYPDTGLWSTLDTYPVVIVAGDIELTEAEGKRLQQYIRDGGTVLVADAQLQGRGAAVLELPMLGKEEEAAGYRWLRNDTVRPSQRYRFKPINGGRSLAATADGKVFCAAFEQGKGRLIFLSVPYGLGIDRAAVPVVARLFAHLTRGLMPVEVEGDVEWAVNKAESGWLVTVLNPAGQLKPQQGIVPTNFRESRTITIKSTVPLKSARDRLQTNDVLVVKDNTVTCVVPAGEVRVIELQ